MFLSITKLKLKTPFHFFGLAWNALRIRRQLKKTPCVRAKFTGFGMTHYTQTLWKSKDDMKAFMESGAHLDSMKRGNRIAKEIKVLTIDGTNVIPWPEAKALLKRQKPSKH